MNIYEAISNRRTIRDFEDRAIDAAILERIIGAGLMAPTNDHLRSWEFVIVNEKRHRADLLKIELLNDKKEINRLLDGWEMEDDLQRNMYHEAIPKQFSMLYNAGALILPFFKVEEELLKPASLSSLNPFASIWCCIENMLLAAASEGIFGVTRIPMKDESEHIRQIVAHPDDYVMPCYVALGYPAKKAVRTAQKSASVKDKIHLNKWK